MARTLWFLIDTLGSLLAMACLLRGYMHWLGVASRDPIGHFVIAITDWIIKPLRRLMPVSRRWDWASIVGALLVAVIMAIAFVLIAGMTHAPVFGLVVLTAVYWLIKWAVWMLIVVVIAQAVLSWVNPHAPIAPTLNALSYPFLMPLRRFIPLVGGIDLSPLALILLMQVALVFLQSTLGAYVLVP
ncbi:MAG: YggT family protein [Burkholderiaceae bacterium]